MSLVEDSVKDFVGNVIKDFGRIDVLVNNAGVMTRPVPITQLEVKKWDYTIAVNLRGPFLITRVGVARHDQAKKRLDHQRFIDGGTRRLRQLYRLCHFKMGAGRIYPDPGRGSPRRQTFASTP